jgi:hypothetical protein
MRKFPEKKKERNKNRNLRETDRREETSVSKHNEGFQQDTETN